MIRLPKTVTGVFAVAVTLGLATPVFADLTTGTIRSVNTERNEIVLKGILKDTTYPLIKSPYIILDGRKAQLKDLRPDDRATVDYQKKGDQVTCFSLRVLRNSSETNGTIRFVIADKNEVVLKGVLKDTVYHLDKNIMVRLNNKECNFSDLREGDDVTLTYQKTGDRLITNEIRATRK